MAEVLTTAQAAERLKVGVRVIRRMIHTGELRGFRASNGRVMRVSSREIDRVLGVADDHGEN